MIVLLGGCTKIIPIYYDTGKLPVPVRVQNPAILAGCSRCYRA